jgi:hypothetical protein
MCSGFRVLGFARDRQGGLVGDVVRGLCAAAAAAIPQIS